MTEREERPEPPEDPAEPEPLVIAFFIALAVFMFAFYGYQFYVNVLR